MSRRSNLRMEDVLKMKELEAAGKSRSEIAKEIQCHQSCVTRHLGAVRSYTPRKKEEEVEQ